MSGNIFWKFVLTAVIIFWCVAEISPLKDRPFEDYIVAQATAENAEFASIMARAGARVDSKKSKTLFLGIT